MSDPLALKDTTLQHLRTNVRTLRLAAGLTLKTAAEHAQMHWRHWQKIESGQINITLQTLVRLAEVLKVDAAALLLEPEQQVN